MDAFAINNQIFTAQVAENDRIFQSEVNDQLVRLAQADGFSGVSCSQDNSAFDAEYSAFQAEIARVRAEIEEDKKRLGF